MVAIADPPRVTRASAPDVGIATAGAAVGAAVVALACLAMPARLLEALVVRSGAAALVNAAAPPLGFTARLLLAAGGGVLAGAVGWAVLVLVAGERRVRLMLPVRRLPGMARRPAAAGPSVRRADSHPDAPPRPPILAARELGTPFLSVVAPPSPPAAAPASAEPADERAVPADLDTALAAVDPAAIPDVPRDPVRAVAALTVPPTPHRPVPLAPGERIDSVELGFDVGDRPDSIEALLSRLERGTRRRPAIAADPAPVVASPEPAPAPPTSSGSLEETLGQLRRLAVRG